MTALLWAASFAWSAWRMPDRPKNYFLMLGIGEFAVMGAFLAQDLLLFVLFFDLMLVPFFFLVGSYGTGDRVRATIKMMVYTLVGSLLMLVAAIATAILTSEIDGRALVRALGPAGERPSRGKPGVDLPVLRRGVPGEDAHLPASRVDARCVPLVPPSGARPALRRPPEGRRLRLLARGPADLPRRDDPVPGPRSWSGPRLDPLRLRDGLHADERAPHRGLLVDRAARLHHARRSSRCRPTARTAPCSRW